MKTIYYYLATFITLISVISCNSGNKEMKTEKQTPKAIDLADLDTTISPTEDFYQYATGGWQKNNPLPDEESRFGSFDLLAKETNQKVNDIIVNLTKQENAENSIEWKIATFYNLGMDSVKLDKDGIKPIEEYLKKIDAISSKDDVLKTIAEFHRLGISSSFAIFGSADRENSKMEIAYLYQGGLGLPNRDYYTADDARSIEIREEYKKHIDKMFDLFKINNTKSEAISKIIFDFEYKLAANSMTNLELRDPYATTNRMSQSELNEISPDFNFETYFSYIKLPQQEVVNVSQPKFFKEFNNVFKNTDIETWKLYLKWNLIRTSSQYLSTEIADASWEFYGKFLTGALVQQPRWRKVVNRTNSSMGEAVGQIFVREYFPPEAKQRMEVLVENLRVAFAKRIEKLDWMSDVTKVQAKEKLAAINVKIGYPNKWRDYSSLKIKNDYYYANVLRANEFDFDDMLSKIGKPVDKEQWFMNPQTVNAYYSASMNEICFPAGILQAPFFYLDADDAVNYGAIGVVIGHEMTHGFDDKGRSYDKDGNLKDWWTEEDAKRFNEKSQVLVERFNNIDVLPDLKADGKLSLGENIADYGGLKISYDALTIALGNETPEKIDGFTAKQRFFLSYAKIWGQNIRDTEIRRRTKEDVHSLGQWRVNGQLPGIKEFHDAFNVKPGDKMYLPPEKWATIW